MKKLSESEFKGKKTLKRRRGKPLLFSEGLPILRISL